MANLHHDLPLNPYEAPQAHELPSAAFAEHTLATTSLVSPPPEVQRLMKAAIILYFVSFVVPYAPWFWSDNQIWFPGMGFLLCVGGVFFFWFPPLFSWWANVMFWLAYRDMNRVSSGSALWFAVTGMILAPIFGIFGSFDFLTSHDYQRTEPLLPVPITSAPYLCWLGSMLVMLIAAIKLRRVVIHSEVSLRCASGLKNDEYG